MSSSPFRIEQSPPRVHVLRAIKGCSCVRNRLVQFAFSWSRTFCGFSFAAGDGVEYRVDYGKDIVGESVSPKIDSFSMLSFFQHDLQSVNR